MSIFFNSSLTSSLLLRGFLVAILVATLVATIAGCSQGEEPSELNQNVNQNVQETEQARPKVAVVTDQLDSEENAVDVSRIAADQLVKYVKFKDKHLQDGFKIWVGTCENCHGYGTAGAPIPMEPAAWKDRIIKGKPVLYQHAIKGFFGPNDTMMPERGGNSKLTDDEVKAAVDYMVALATHYIEKN